MIGIARNMWCMVKLPNSVVLEVDVDPKADAHDCLQKVLEHVHIIEEDYFGLQHITKDTGPTWLNLRNPLERQLTGPPPYRLSLKVKFFVQPHRLIQNETRELFYENIKQSFLAGELHFVSDEEVAAMAACMAQAEYGDPGGQCSYGRLLPASHAGLAPQAAAQHEALAGTAASAAKYQLLQLAAKTACYGTTFFQVGLEASAIHVLYPEPASQVKGQSPHFIGVGPEGVTVYSEAWTAKETYPYSRVHRITHSHRTFCLLIFNEDGTDFPLDFRLGTKPAASALYRHMTEMFCFYLCETVRDNVVSQFSRDLKGTLASLFNENSTVGRKYMFDIRRTSNEAYDHYRRLLYRAPEPAAPAPPAAAGECSTGHCQALQLKLQRLEESVLCCLCVDAPLSVLFSPCQHLVCCQACAARLDTCPVCRTPIDSAATIFMPGLLNRDELDCPVARL